MDSVGIKLPDFTPSYPTNTTSAPPLAAPAMQLLNILNGTETDTLTIRHRPTSSVADTMGAVDKELPFPHHRVPPPFPVSQSIIHPYSILTNDEYLLTTFLQHILDKANNIQSLVWHVLDIGTSLVGKNALLVLLQNRTVQCYGRVERLLVADEEQVALEVLVMGWNTSWGFRSPDGLFSAVAIVSREHLTAPYRQRAQHRQICKNVSLFVNGAIVAVHDYLRHGDLKRVSSDPVTSALMDAFAENTAMRFFYTGQGMNAAYAFKDRNALAGVSIPEPPYSFNTDALAVRSLHFLCSR